MLVSCCENRPPTPLVCEEGSVANRRQEGAMHVFYIYGTYTYRNIIR